MMELHFPWLTAAVVVPLVGAMLIHRLRDLDRAFLWCVAIAGLTFLLTTAACIDFFVSEAAAARDWGNSLLGSWELLRIDQLSAPLLPLVALLHLLTILATLRTKQRRFSFPLSLVSESISLATLSCFWPWPLIILLALGTLPMLWHLRVRHKPIRVYVLHMGMFIILLVIGWLLVSWEGNTREHSLILMTPLLLAVLIRCGIAPFHCWMTDLFEHASFGASLLFVTPMVGAYAAVRLLVPIASDDVIHALGVVSLLTAVYAAGMALVQTEARRFFCYVFLSHSALVLVGLDTVSEIGLTGGLCVWLSLGISLAGFGLTLRALEARHGRLSLIGYHGVYEHTPLLAVCFVLTGMASVGFPGTFGFIGTELLIDGVVQTYPYIGIAVVIAAALNGIAVVQAYFKLFTGTRHVSSVSLDVTRRERVVVLLMAGLILVGGLVPQIAIESRLEAAKGLLTGRNGEAPPPSAHAAGPVVSPRQANEVAR